MLDVAFRSAAPAPRLPSEIYGPLFRAGVGVLQLRCKDAPAGYLLALLAELLAHRPPGTLLVVNDRLDVALAGGADGVHLGQQDLPLRAARRVSPPGFLIGVSTHSAAQAAAAMHEGADYVGFGPIFATASKRNPEPCVGLAELRAVCAGATIPVVAIGGITHERLPEVIAAGAHAVAIIAAVNQAADIHQAAVRVQRHFGLGSPETA
jgi:thiamine-phosphate pyrophosphorylase